MSFNSRFGQTSYGLSNAQLQALSNLNPVSIPFLNTVNQSLNVTSSPGFNSVKLGTSPNTVTLKASGSVTGAREVTFPDSDVTITQYSGPNQSVSTSGTPQFTKIGVNQSAGTEALEVNGNIKCTDLKPTGNWYWAGGEKNIVCDSTIAADNFSFDITPLAGSYATWSVWNQPDTGDVISAKITRGSSGGIVGINQAPGTEALEVNGNVSASTLIAGAVNASGTPNQGCHIEWNRDGSSGETYIMNQRGGGVGGMRVGSVTASNVFESWLYLNHLGYPLFEKGEIRLLNSGHYARILSSALTAERTLTLPNADLTLTAHSGPNQSLDTTATTQFAKVGINQSAGTETLEVNGNIKCTDLKPTGNWYWAGGEKNVVCTATTATDNFSFDISPLVGSYATWSVWNGVSPFGNAISAKISYGVSGGVVGINQAPGTEALEVNGNAKLTGTLKLVNGSYTNTIQTTTLGSNRTLTLPDSDLTLTSYSGPNQSLNTTATPQFAKLGINQASGSEALEVSGCIKATDVIYTAKPRSSSLNTVMFAGISNIQNDDMSFIATGSGKEVNYESAIFGYKRLGTLADSYGVMAVWGGSGAVYWNAGNKVGINQVPGTEVLEVNGNVKCADVKPTGDYHWAPGKNFVLNATDNNQEWSFDVDNKSKTGVGSDMRYARSASSSIGNG